MLPQAASKASRHASSLALGRAYAGGSRVSMPRATAPLSADEAGRMNRWRRLRPAAAAGCTGRGSGCPRDVVRRVRAGSCRSCGDPAGLGWRGAHLRRVRAGISCRRPSPKALLGRLQAGGLARAGRPLMTIWRLGAQLRRWRNQARCKAGRNPLPGRIGAARSCGRQRRPCQRGQIFGAAAAALGAATPVKLTREQRRRLDSEIVSVRVAFARFDEHGLTCPAAVGAT